ncbi:sensor histidine kinase (plasmid) [Streptomyces sp. JL4002]|uniref:sensor histidine kinase n=1 Tax=Streptomyces sp. JL4002 TaxID=3404781 RepID=UPI003B27EB35
MLNATTRIRRLRRRLTVLFTLTSTAGLIGLTLYAAHLNNSLWRGQLDDELHRRTSRATALLVYDPGERLVFDGLIEDDVDSNCPALTVLAQQANGPVPVRRPRRPCAKVADKDLVAIARRATADVRQPVAATVTDQAGRQVRLYAEAFPNADFSATGGAVVVADDMSADIAGHRQVVLLLAIACAAFAGLSALAGHMLSGRAMWPALAALAQQEAFLADAAHDLRTPLATLRALTEGALHDDASRGEALSRAARLAARTGDIVDDLLTRARLAAGVTPVRREPLRLDQLVESILDDTPTAGHRIRVTAQPVVVTADPTLLRRAVANLLDNALTHGHQPGAPADVEITLTADGTIAIDDDGPGIDPALAGELFDRYHSGGHSTGLGLSIAAWIAHAHGGSLTVGPSARGGARFVLRV